MMKVIVVYDSVFGNTRDVGKAILGGMGEAAVIEGDIVKAGDVELEKLDKYDMILIGSPNHVTGSTMPVRSFIGKLGKINPDGKHVAVFDTYAGSAKRQAVTKMEKWLNDKASGLELISPGLSVKVDGIAGPLAQGQLPRCREFGIHIAEQLKTLV